MSWLSKPKFIHSKNNKCFMQNIANTVNDNFFDAENLRKSLKNITELARYNAQKKATTKCSCFLYFESK